MNKTEDENRFIVLWYAEKAFEITFSEGINTNYSDIFKTCSLKGLSPKLISMDKDSYYAFEHETREKSETDESQLGALICDFHYNFKP